MTETLRPFADAPPRRARMGHYALWQLRDYMIERGLPTALLAGLAGVLGALAVRAVLSPKVPLHAGAIATYGSEAAARHALLAQASTDFLGSIVGIVVFVGAVLATNGLVSNDRKLGFYRFLFAKPVTPVRYYAQAWVLHAAGFVAIIALLAALWNALVAPVFGAPLVLAMALVYLCYSGLGFLLGAAAKWDWLSLVAVTVVSELLWRRFGESASPFARALYLLPPITKIEAVYARAAQHLALPWQILAWLAGYGLACFVAGLLVLRHRRLATS